MTIRRHYERGRPRQLVVKTRTTIIIAPTTAFHFSLLLLLLLAPGAARGHASKSSSNNNAKVKTLSSSPSSSCVAADGSLVATTAVVVSTTNEATQLSQNLLRCPGSTFEAEWRGSVQISEPLALSDETSLKIVGSQGETTASTVHGHGSTALFELNNASLRLEGLALTGGSAAEGSAVAARDDALVTFVDCEVYENVATSKGGERDHWSAPGAYMAFFYSVV